MELRIVLSVISLIFSGILQTVTPALIRQETQPVVTTSSPHHIRTKRCSCASFLDKECVYFCHLDIIWINTPERTVSYGLGSAPRKKRSLANPLVLLHTQQSRRCECLDNEDSTCLRFCQPDNPPRLQAANIPTQRNNCPAWQYLYNLTANKREIKRTQNKSQRSRMPSPLRSMRRAAHWHRGGKTAAL